MSNRTSRATIRKRKNSVKPITETLRYMVQEALDIDAQIAELDERRKELRKHIYDYLPDNNERYTDGVYIVRKIMPHKSSVFSSSICKTLYSKIYDDCKEEKEYNGYVTISVI